MDLGPNKIVVGIPQVLRLMDRLWKQSGLHMGIIAYGCVATGDEEGLVRLLACLFAGFCRRYKHSV